MAGKGADRRVVHDRTVLGRAVAGVGFVSNRARRRHRGDPRLFLFSYTDSAQLDHSALGAGVIAGHSSSRTQNTGPGRAQTEAGRIPR